MFNIWVIFSLNIFAIHHICFLFSICLILLNFCCPLITAQFPFIPNSNSLFHSCCWSVCIGVYFYNYYLYFYLANHKKSHLLYHQCLNYYFRLNRSHIRMQFFFSRKKWKQGRGKESKWEVCSKQTNMK